jgi:two-component system response regulator FixJ
VPNTIYVIGLPGDESRRVAGVVAPETDCVRLCESSAEFFRMVTPESRGCVLASSALMGGGMCALIQGIGARGLRLPVVVLACDADLATAVEFMRAGAAEYVELPVLDRHLRKAVRQALALGESDQYPLWRPSAIRGYT